MTRLFILVCLMTLVTGVSMGANRDWGDYLEFPQALDRFRQTIATIKRLEDIPNRNLEEQRQFEAACDESRWRAGHVAFHRIRPINTPEGLALANQRWVLLYQIMYGEFRLSSSWSDLYRPRTTIVAITPSTP